MSESTTNMGLTKPTMSDTVTELVDGMRSNLDILDAFYPVGAIWWCTKDKDPAKIFGGAWSRIEDVFIMCAGTNHAAGSTGGAETHQHLMPIGFDNNMMYGFYNPTGDTPGYGSIVQTANTKKWGIDSSEATSAQRIAYTKAAASLPPFKAAYAWERVA
jgi:hypothetical protein